jgi:ubiquinone/menaquinone biosynthesis C-methylase UbiE
MTRMPFRDGTFEAAVSLSAIYHIPAERQLAAFVELERVLRRGGTAAVAYSWGKYSRLMLPFDAAPAKFLAILRGWRRPGAGTGDPPLYFHAHSHAWFRRVVQPVVHCQIAVWRLVSVPFLRWYVPSNRIGRTLLRMVYRIEERWPGWSGRWGQYPLIVIRRP